eukprot:2131916-Prymnesium_polylepis.2
MPTSNDRLCHEVVPVVRTKLFSPGTRSLPRLVSVPPPSSVCFQCLRGAVAPNMSEAYHNAERCLLELTKSKPAWLLHAERSAKVQARQDAQQAALSSGLGPHGFARENDIRALIPREHVGHAATHVFREDSSMNCSGPICRPGTRVVNLPNETPQQ